MQQLIEIIHSRFPISRLSIHKEEDRRFGGFLVKLHLVQNVGQDAFYQGLFAAVSRAGLAPFYDTGLEVPKGDRHFSIFLEGKLRQRAVIYTEKLDKSEQEKLRQRVKGLLQGKL